MDWTKIDNRNTLFKTVHETVKEDHPFQGRNDLTNGPRYAIPFMLRKTLNKLPAPAKDLMLSLLTSQVVVDSAPGVRGVNSDQHGAMRQWHRNGELYLPKLTVDWSTMSDKAWLYHLFIWEFRGSTNDQGGGTAIKLDTDAATKSALGVKEGNNGWTIVDASKRFTTLVAPPTSTMATRLAQVVTARLNPAVEPIGYEEYTTGGTGCNMERAIYDYINNRAYYSPSHYEPFDLTTNTIQSKSTAAGLISPFFGVTANYTGI